MLAFRLPVFFVVAISTGISMVVDVS